MDVDRRHLFGVPPVSVHQGPRRQIPLPSTPVASTGEKRAAKGGKRGGERKLENR